MEVIKVGIQKFIFMIMASYSGENPVRSKQYYLENFSAWLESAKEESAQYKADTTEPE